MIPPDFYIFLKTQTNPLIAKIARIAPIIRLYRNRTAFKSTFEVDFTSVAFTSKARRKKDTAVNPQTSMTKDTSKNAGFSI